MFGRSSTSTRTGTPVREGDTVVEERAVDGRTDPAIAQEARRDKFGGLNPGAAFFGWLVAMAVAILLTSIVGADRRRGRLQRPGHPVPGPPAGRHHRPGRRDRAARGADDRLLLRRYVAGRMSRFSGTRQGLGVWLIGLLVTVIAIVLGAVFGQQYDILSRVNLPRLPISSDDLTTGGVIAALLVLGGTLVAALAGGSIGTHYHRRVDNTGYRA